MTTNHFFSLEGKIALITGGGSGIGNAIAQCMVAAGATVVITGRREEPLKEAVAQLGEKAHYIVNDVTVLEHLEALVEEIETSIGPIDIRGIRRRFCTGGTYQFARCICAHTCLRQAHDSPTKRLYSNDFVDGCLLWY
jgi:NADPH:quinone reductase-like Zn-dependent oxidoreductase